MATARVRFAFKAGDSGVPEPGCYEAPLSLVLGVLRRRFLAKKAKKKFVHIPPSLLSFFPMAFDHRRLRAVNHSSHVGEHCDCLRTYTEASSDKIMHQFVSQFTVSPDSAYFKRFGLRVRRMRSEPFPAAGFDVEKARAAWSELVEAAKAECAITMRDKLDAAAQITAAAVARAEARLGSSVTFAPWVREGEEAGAEYSAED